MRRHVTAPAAVVLVLFTLVAGACSVASQEQPGIVDPTTTAGSVESGTIATTATSTSTSTLPPESPSPLNTGALSILPADEFEFLMNAASRKTGELTATCLLGEGFSEEQVRSYQERLAVDPVGTPTVDTGFGLLEMSLLNASAPESTPADRVSDAPGFNSLFVDDTERAAFWAAEQSCIIGAIDSFSRYQILVRPSAQVKVEDEELQRALNWYADVRAEVEEQIGRDSELVEARQAWVDCMVGAGYRFGSKESMYGALQLEGDRVVGSLDSIPASIDDLSASSPADRESVLAQLDREVAIKGASDACDVPIILAERAARQRIESVYAAENAVQLALVTDYLTALYRELVEFMEP